RTRAGAGCPAVPGPGHGEDDRLRRLADGPGAHRAGGEDDEPAGRADDGGGDAGADSTGSDTCDIARPASPDHPPPIRAGSRDESFVRPTEYVLLRTQST